MTFLGYETTQWNAWLNLPELEKWIDSVNIILLIFQTLQYYLPTHRRLFSVGRIFLGSAGPVLNEYIGIGFSLKNRMTNISMTAKFGRPD